MVVGATRHPKRDDMDGTAGNIHIEVDFGDALDASEVERETLGLQSELRPVDGVEVAPASSTTPPPGAKSGATAMAGELALVVSSGAMGVIVHLLQDWLRRRRTPCTVTVSLGEGVVAQLHAGDDPEEIRRLVAQLRGATT